MSVRNFFGFFDYRIYAPVMLARAIWLRGFAAQACGLAKTAIDDTPSRANPVSICVSLSNGSPVFLWSGDFQSAENYAERLIAYAGRHALELYRAAGVGLKGAVAIARDELETGIDLLRDAVETPTAAKMNIWLTEFMGPLADGLRKSGQLEEALITINRAIEHATDCGSTFDMGELLRVKAAVLTAMPQHGRNATIKCLTEALAVAKAQSALALELRSTIDLARLLSEGGQRDQARQALAEMPRADSVKLSGRFCQLYSNNARIRQVRRGARILWPRAFPWWPAPRSAAQAPARGK